MFNSQRGARNESLMEDLYFLKSQSNFAKFKTFLQSGCQTILIIINLIPILRLSKDMKIRAKILNQILRGDTPFR